MIYIISSITAETDMDKSDDSKPDTLSPAHENYLEIIFLEEVRYGFALASKIAEEANVSRASVTSALKTLSRLGMIEYRPYSPIRLTEAGRLIGRDICHRHMIFKEFFSKILLIEKEEADRTACELEHIVPENIIRRLGQFLLYMQSHPLPGDWMEQYMKERSVILAAMEAESHKTIGGSDSSVTEKYS